MSSDEIESGNRKYEAQPVCLLRLASGRIAVLSGFNPRQPLAFLSEHEVIDFVLGLRFAPQPTFDLDDLII